MWKTFDEDCQSVDTALTTMEHELSHFNASDATFQQMKAMLLRLKVMLRTVTCTLHTLNCIILSFSNLKHVYFYEFVCSYIHQYSEPKIGLF